MNVGRNSDIYRLLFLEKDKNIFLEYPSMIREFDDEYVKEQLKENDKIIEIETDKENIDI